MNKQPMVKLFLDSGAFSAFSQGVEIDIDEYISFIKKHERHIETYANLDVIGDADATRKNQLYMEKKGLRPLPCFHYGEPLSFLKWYLERYDYIALGGMVPISTRDLSRWLDSLFSEHICDGKGMPRVKIHGFGLTSLKLMLRYPWYSVDSTSWVVTGRMGSVMVPKPWKGPLSEPWKVTVSSQSPGRKEEGKHIMTLPPSQRKMILEYFKSKGYALGRSSFRKEEAGYKWKKNEKPTGKVKKGVLAHDQKVEIIEEPGLCNDYRLRDELNIIYFLDLEKAMPEWPWSFRLETKSMGFGI